MPVLIHPYQDGGRDPQDEEEEDRQGDALFDLAEKGMDLSGGVSDPDQSCQLILHRESLNDLKDFLPFYGAVEA